MRKMLIVLGGLLALVIGAAPGSASAGGWAVVSYDPLPELVAGEQATISFVVLQHGVTPVSGESLGADLELAVTGPTGAVMFPANPTELLGQFSATVDVPADSTEIDLTVHWGGGLALQQAAIAVPVAPPSSAAGGMGWTPVGFGALALVGAGLFMSGQTTTSRRSARHEHDATVPA